jgi:hypothetical protein
MVHLKQTTGKADLISMRKLFLSVIFVALLIGTGLAFKAMSNWQVNARTSAFVQDVDNLFAGLQQYKDFVGRYPMGSNADIAKALMGQNPKKLIILVNRKTELNEKGEFVDPWNTPLRIYYHDTGIMVRSAGPNRRFDDSSAVDCDDYFKSN